ncbi:hypothetical protein PI124_g3357 [Phytophthora idaei]|nr:hypothetical protein PI125_g13722 [Phytophthora idaei]KAG3171113.1 hypothetical protein PI126_g2018 [Phytophthora idaei]KAG3252034.1 hypothetical protein PI124_g3357 [Phytophthora idaei]
MPTPVRLRVKIGEITKASRNDVHVAEHVFSFDKECDTYEVFCRKVGERVVEGLRNYLKKTIRPDTSIYIKPSQTARQRDWVALTAENFAPRIASAYTNYQKRTKDSGPFKIEVFVLAARKEQRVLLGTRHATASKVQEAATTIDNYLEQRHDLQVGEIAPTHWSISHARQPEGTTVALPDTATFAQAQHIDAMQADERVEVESDFRIIHVRIHESREFQLTINVPGLHRVMGLPNYDLLACGIFESFVPPPEPE